MGDFMIKAILFDFDGVICDTEPLNFNFKLEKMKEMGFPVTKEFLLARVGESFSVMFPREFQVENSEKYVKEYYSDYKKAHTDYKSILYPEVPILLEYCKQKNIICVIASNSNHSRLEKAVKDIELEEYFYKLYSNELLQVSKPNPLFYTKVVEDLGFNKDEVIVIEDSVHGIEAAVHAGLYTIAKKEYFFNLDQSLANIQIDKHTEVIEIIERMNIE